MTTISTEHIELDNAGVARISGTRTKVIQIVMDKMAYAWGSEEIQRQYPHLSLAEVHAAMAYYYDHQKELDLQVAEDLKEADSLRAESSESPIVAKLRAKGHLP